MSISTSTPTLTLGNIKTLGLAALGGALEFYDFIVFVFFASVIGQLFFPPEISPWLRQLQTFGLFAAGYLARPLGGIVMAHFGDLLGRKKMFTFSIFIMAVPTLMIGLLPTYLDIGMVAPLLLLLLRLLQGMAIGGEVPGAWVFVAEHVPSRFVGLACGILTAGLTAGIFIGSLVAKEIYNLFTVQEVSAYAWRFPFLLGGVFGIIAVYLRRWLEETPLFLELRQQKALAREMPLKMVLREHRSAMLLSMLLTWLLSAAIVVVILMTPTLLQKQHGVSAADSLLANNFATIALTLGCVVFGFLCDVIGKGKSLLLGSAMLLASASWFYVDIAVSQELLLVNYTLVGFCVGVVGVVPSVMVNLFPTVVRFSGLSFSYNLAYAIFGGLTPVIVTLMLKWNVFAPLYYVGTLCLLGVVIALYLMISESEKAATTEIIYL
ncbi:MAG: MFS transporter [Oligoflexia bacterium]|nr:MFS transporter [Oligoflexia bacterium]MBF0367210.1 MFS transporter [Oligoflexia bacterium]